MALRAFDGGDELVCPLLAVGGIIALHHLAQVVDDAIVGTEVIGGGVYLLLADLHVLQTTIHHFLHGFLA